jgi:chemotaxis receptor (MCP) glutamine deamidase CheD
MSLFHPKYANTAVPALAKEIRAIAGKESRLSAKIIGGANMFANFSANRLDRYRSKKR